MNVNVCSCVVSYLSDCEELDESALLFLLDGLRMIV